MSNNNIYEIAQMMQNKNVIKNDLNEAFSIITTMFQDRYINKLNTAIEIKHLECKKKPSREITLLNSLKPFFKIEQHENINKTINTLYMIQTLQHLKKDTNINTTNNTNFEDSSIHEDGVYDIDDNCIFNQGNSTNSLLNIALLLAITSL